MAEPNVNAAGRPGPVYQQTPSPLEAAPLQALDDIPPFPFVPSDATHNPPQAAVGQAAVAPPDGQAAPAQAQAEGPKRGLFESASLFVGGVIVGAIVGIPLLVGAILYKTGEAIYDAGVSAHKSMAAKAAEQGFVKKSEEHPSGRSSPVLDYCKDGACRFATQINKFFKYEVGSPKFSPSLYDSSKFKIYDNSRSIINFAMDYGNKNNPFISNSDIDFYNRITKNDYNPTEAEKKQCSEIALKVGNRIKVFEMMSQIDLITLPENDSNRDNVRFSSDDDQKVFKNLWNKMNDQPPRPLSTEEVTQIDKILGKVYKKEGSEYKPMFEEKKFNMQVFNDIKNRL